jgi:hypothetical protein
MCLACTWQEKLTAYQALAAQFDTERAKTHGPYWALEKDELQAALFGSCMPAQLLLQLLLQLLCCV